MHELEATLREAGRRFPFDETPHVVDGVLPYLAERPRPRRNYVVVAAASALAVAGATLALSPAARSEVRAWLGALPGVDIEQVDALPPFPVDAAPPYMGDPVHLEIAREAVPWELRVPSIDALGPPTEIFLRNDVPGGIVTLVYGREPRALLSQWRGTISNASYQLVSEASRVERISLDGREAVWLEGRVQATYTYVGADGELHREALPVWGNVLLWEVDGIAFRLETAAAKDQAVQAAESLSGK